MKPIPLGPTGEWRTTAAILISSFRVTKLCRSGFVREGPQVASHTFPLFLYLYQHCACAIPASESSTNWSSQVWWADAGAVLSCSIRCSKVSFHTSVHINWLPVSVNLYSGLTTSANRQRSPRSARTSFGAIGVGQSNIAETFSSSAEMPSLLTTRPRKVCTPLEKSVLYWIHF